MIKTKALLRAMSFLFVPTLAILSVILVGFFSWTKFVAFMTSSTTEAILVRVIMLISEITLVIIMYFHYIKEEIVKKSEKDDAVFGEGNYLSSDDTMYYIMRPEHDEKVYSYKITDKITVLKKVKND